MMIDLKPLDVLDSRKLDFIPNHFSKVPLIDFWLYERIDMVSWIRNHSHGRYAIERYPSSKGKEVLKSTTFVGFEEEKELTYFVLACPYFRR
jgi:hypothetical protein